MATTDDNGPTLREYLEGRLDRLAADSATHIAVLRELYDERIKSMEQVLSQRLDEQNRAVEAARESVSESTSQHAEAHKRDHEATTLASEKAEKRTDERFARMEASQREIENERMTYVRI